MNERIRELVKRAGGHFATHNLMSNPVQHRESIELWDKNIEKFAELIVRECCNKIESEYKYALGEKTQWAMSQDVQDLLKEHFGVEE